MGKAKEKTEKRLELRIKGYEETMKRPNVSEGGFTKPGSRKKVH